MTIRLSHAQARALTKLSKVESVHYLETGETRSTLDALVIAGYARKDGERYTKIKELCE